MSRLNFHHLHYFWAVAKEGNLTRAASRIHVSQSALSAQIKQLEEQLGQRLFTRAGRGLQLTEAGRLALGYADSIFAAGAELTALLREGRREALPQVVSALRTTDALDACEEMAEAELRQARLALAQLPDSPYRDALGVLADYALHRRN